MKLFRNGIKIKDNQSRFNLDTVVSFIILFILGVLLIAIGVFIVWFHVKIIELLFLIVNNIFLYIFK